jgi:pyruvate,water dikinase
MTWAIVREFMSGRGGYGLMLRDLGFDPDPIIDEQGFIDLVCGRPYVNLSREPKLYFRDFPSSHPFAALKANPEKAMYPQALPDREKVNARFLIRLPIILWKMISNYSQMQRQSRIWAERLRTQVFPQFADAVSQENKLDLGALTDQELLESLHRWIQTTLNDFARQSLRPSVFAALAMANLEQALKRNLGAEGAASAVREALTGVHPDPEADLPSALERLVRGELSSAEFLDRFGHRGPQEMELAQPRWREVPQQLPGRESGNPLKLTRPSHPEERWARLLQQAGLGPKEASPLRQDFELAQTYAGLRETSKHYLMMGYAQIRRILLELDQRHELRDGIFYLEPAELGALIAGRNLRPLIKERRQRRQLALSLEVPAVLFSDDLEAVGRPVGALGATELQGIPLSAGVAEGPALVLSEPSLPARSNDYILVCPSTDPAWVPLFLHARALVMESGGVLSHGAIVAREFGLPAVAGLPSIHRRLRTGQKLKVDGNTGKLFVYD